MVAIDMTYGNIAYYFFSLTPALLYSTGVVIRDPSDFLIFCCLQRGGRLKCHAEDCIVYLFYSKICVNHSVLTVQACQILAKSGSDLHQMGHIQDFFMSPGFFLFGANLTNFGPKSEIPVSVTNLLYL